MRTDARMYLYDIERAISGIEEDAHALTFDEYERDRTKRRSIEREFEIIGEAMARLARRAPDVADRITDYQRIIAFRNFLAHEYQRVDNSTVWDAIHVRLPTLRREVEALMAEE